MIDYQISSSSISVDLFTFNIVWTISLKRFFITTIFALENTRLPIENSRVLKTVILRIGRQNMFLCLSQELLPLTRLPKSDDWKLRGSRQSSVPEVRGFIDEVLKASNNDRWKRRLFSLHLCFAEVVYQLVENHYVLYLIREPERTSERCWKQWSRKCRIQSGKLTKWYLSSFRIILSL